MREDGFFTATEVVYLYVLNQTQVFFAAFGVKALAVAVTLFLLGAIVKVL